MAEPTLADIQKEIAELRRELTSKRVVIVPVEPIAISAGDVAKLLKMRVGEVYQLHHAGQLDGFKPYPRANLKFLLTDVRKLAEKMADERRNT